MPFLTSTEKLWFPSLVVALQVVMLILFGVLVEYDEFGSPVETNNPSAIPDSDGNIQQSYPLFQDVHVMIFVGFGFLMTFLRRYGYGSIGFNLLLAALVLQWGTLTNGLFSFIEISDLREDLPDDEEPSYKIKANLLSMIGADFAAAAVLITFGAVLGRASPFQMMIIAFMECICYSANDALNINVLKAADAGGSMLIHTFGAYFGLAVSVMLYRKKASSHPRNSSTYRSDLFSIIGTLFLWIFWPSFNGALVTGDARYRAIINTYFSLSGSVLASFVTSMFVDPKRKLDMVHIQNATLAGGVAVGAVADMVIEPWGAVLIGCCSGVISVLGYTYLSPQMDRWFYLQDTCGVHNLHGLPGVFSAIASSVAASIARKMETDDNHVEYGNSLYVVFPARAPEGHNSTICGLNDVEVSLGVECGDGRSGPQQAGYQLALLVCTLTIAVLGGIVTGFVASLPLFQQTADSEFFDDDPYWNLADDADNYLPQSHKDPQLAATSITAGRDDTDKAASSLFPAKGKGSKKDDDLSSVTSLELQTTL